jgi:hypothetical protein
MERAVAVFGSSDPVESDPDYAAARRVGELLAHAGYMVITGGYGGVMEAASRGAREAGGQALGITARALQPLRAGPNRYLTRHLEADGLLDRTHELIDLSLGYIILPGKAGTLAELTALWALHRARLLENRPIVLLGDSWRSFIDRVRALGMLDPGQLEITHLADTPDEAVALILQKIR